MIALGNHIDGILIGDRAAAVPVVGCGQCKESESGLEIFCTKGWWLYRVCLPKYARVHVRGALKSLRTMAVRNHWDIEN